MPQIGQLFTSGQWLVKPGKEDEFISAGIHSLSGLARTGPASAPVTSCKTRLTQGVSSPSVRGTTRTQFRDGVRRLSSRVSLL